MRKAPCLIQNLRRLDSTATSSNQSTLAYIIDRRKKERKELL